MVVIAAEDVSAAGPPIVASTAALGLPATLAAVPAWVPELLAVLPGRSTIILTALCDQVDRSSRGIGSRSQQAQGPGRSSVLVVSRPSVQSSGRATGASAA